MAKSAIIKQHIKRAKRKQARKYLKYRIKKLLHIRELPDVHKYDVNLLDLNYDDAEIERSGKSRLFHSEQRKVIRIKSLEEQKAKKVLNDIKNFNRKIENLKENIKDNKKKLALMIGLVVSIVCIISIPFVNKLIYNDYISKVFTDSVVTVLNIDMNNDTKKLDYTIENLAINSNGNYISISKFDWLNFDINTESPSYAIGSKEYKISKNVSIDKFSISEQKGHIVYSNIEQTASKELILSPNKDIEGIKNIPIKSYRLYEKRNTISTRAYMQTKDNSIIYLSETLGGGELTDMELTSELKDIEDSISLSNMYTGIELKLNGVGVINIDSLDANTIEYNRNDDVLIIKNNDTNDIRLLIFDMENSTIGCKAEEFIETTQDGLFIHKMFNIEDSKHYGVFAILKNNELYTFKALGTDVEKTFVETCSQLGFDTENLEIKVVQPVISEE